MADKVRVAVNGYGVIGKRVADAVSLQDDMELIGVADVVHDYRIRVAVERGYPVYASVPESRAEMEAAGIPVAGGLEDLLRQVEGRADVLRRSLQSLEEPRPGHVGAGGALRRSGLPVQRRRDVLLRE
jgi:glyceraldehyde-3-phosphate dehydrogenase (NAD(P))